MMSRLDYVTSGGLILTLCVVLYAMTGVSACDFCLPGGSGYTDPPPTFSAITLVHPTSSPLGDVEVRHIDRPGPRGYDNFGDGQFSLEPGGQAYFFNSTLYREGTIVHQPRDSLSFCSFGQSSSRMLCVVQAADSLLNPFTDQRLDVRITYAGLSLWDTFDTPPFPLLADSAQFTREDRYAITTIENPVLSHDERWLAYIRRTQERQIVLNEAGALVNDIEFFAQNDLMLLDLSGNAEPTVLLENVDLDDNPFRRLAISPDGSHIAVGLDDQTIQLIRRETSEVRQLDGVEYPTFSPQGTYLFGIKVIPSIPDNLLLYRVDDLSLVTTLGVSSASTYAVRPDEQVVYYTENNDMLLTYSMEGGERASLGLHMLFNDFTRDAFNTRASTSAFFFLEAPANENLYIFGNFYFEPIEDC